ncbi:hypothetical protein ACWDR1_32320 [Streptosporangium sandarakinum]
MANAAEPCWQEWMPSLERCALGADASAPHSSEASRNCALPSWTACRTVSGALLIAEAYGL